MCRVEGEGSSRLARTRALVSFLAFPVSLEQFRNFFSGIQASAVDTRLDLTCVRLGCWIVTAVHANFCAGVDQHCFARSDYAYRALADASIMCARWHAVQQKPSPWLLGSHNPIPCRSDSEICRFWCLNNQWATLRHQHIASHQLRITAQGPSYNNPPCRRRSSIAGP